MRVAVVTLALLAAGCGPSLRSASRGPAPAQPNDTFLVQVTDTHPSRSSRSAVEVSLSVIEFDRRDPLPGALSDGQVAEMKAFAASRGANVLLLERLDSPWRKAIYGAGLRYVAGTEPKPFAICRHAAAARAIEAARKRAAECFERLVAERPGLKGRVEVLLEIDAFGDVRRAVPSPASSRDTQVQRCALAAAFRQHYGEPPELACRTVLKTGI